MFVTNYQAIYFLVSQFLLFTRAVSRSGEKTPDILSIKGTESEIPSKPKEFDNEVKEFEEKLKRLKQMLAEESQKVRTTTNSPFTLKPSQHFDLISNEVVSQSSKPPPYPQKDIKPWFQHKPEHTEAAKYHLDKRVSDLFAILNPINVMPSVDDLLKPLKALTAATQHFIPEPFRFNGDMRKATEMFSKLLTRDMPQLLQRMPESLEGMIHSLNMMRKNGTESARNETLGLFDKISRNLFVWTIIMAETDLMTTLSLGLMCRAFIHGLKATPLPTEVMKLQTSLNSVSLHLSETFPLTIKVLSSGPFGNTTEDLNQLVKNINQTNQALDALQNQADYVQLIMDRTPTTTTVLDKKTLEDFYNSMTDLIEAIERLLQNIPLATSLLFNQNEYMMRFLNELSQTFIENGAGWKTQESIENAQKKLQQIFNLKELMPFLNSSNPIGKTTINLLTHLQSLFFTLHSSIFKPSAIISTRTLTLAVEGCIDAIQALTSVNPYLPPVFLQPLMFLLQIFSKLLKIRTNQNQ